MRYDTMNTGAVIDLIRAGLAEGVETFRYAGDWTELVEPLVPPRGELLGWESYDTRATAADVLEFARQHRVALDNPRTYIGVIHGNRGTILAVVKGTEEGQ